uniref:Putative short-chain dehydrogenase/reductase family 42E member 2 n=1 Tax=Stegastes partitus TaxID=144197 RepID=A0A3B4ZTI9_9TELE
MSETGGPLCQLKQLPCHAVPLRRLQAGGHHVHNLPHLTHQPWVNHPAPALASSPAVRHRVNGATAAACGNPEYLASRLGEEAALGRDASRGKVVVTGGGGYFGFRLGRELLAEGLSVVLLDLNKPPGDVPDGAVFYQLQSDIRDYSSLYKVCEGADCIFHTASYGMSGPEQLRKEQVESVNVGGTNNVINCKERSIPRLVYTSTINVVFTGKPIEDGDEASVPYVPPDVHIDHYSRTKAIAEQMVLSANGCSLKGGLLRTCVLRPCGIYGPEERRHLHRVMVNVERRLFSFRFGDPQARMNWVHVDNLVLAHTLAAEALTLKKSCVASGQAYFINDGVSVNLFEWLTPLFEQLGHSRPVINLPVSLVYSAILVEYLHVVLRPVIEVPLLFTRSEQVRNIAVSHTFKIDKACQELGYCPKPYSLADSVEQYLKSRQPRSSSPFSSLSWTFKL